MDAQGNSYAPFDTEIPGSQSEAFTEDVWFDMDRTSGVVEGFGLTFSGRTAQLAGGMARVRGSRLRRAAVWTDTSPATPAGGAPRRDVLVARRQKTTGEGAQAVPGKTFLTVVRGTPAANPVDSGTDLVNDEPLWSWQVPGNGGNTVTDVRDLRRPLRPGPGDLAVSLEGTVLRSDGEDELNASNFGEGADQGQTLLKVYPTAGRVVGPWVTDYEGRGAFTQVPGLYSVELNIGTAFNGPRFIEPAIRGTASRSLPADVASTGFGSMGGSTLIEAPNGLLVYFSSYTGLLPAANGTVTIRNSFFKIRRIGAAT